jgi:hypothetical protein
VCRGSARHTDCRIITRGRQPHERMRTCLAEYQDGSRPFFATTIIAPAFMQGYTHHTRTAARLALAAASRPGPSGRIRRPLQKPMPVHRNSRGGRRTAKNFLNAGLSRSDCSSPASTHADQFNPPFAHRPKPKQGNAPTISPHLAHPQVANTANAALQYPRIVAAPWLADKRCVPFTFSISYRICHEIG